MIKIMIVDDEQIVRQGIKFIIDKEFSGILKVVAIAKSGREAIELFEEERPSIILMDIQMPGINGIEAIKQIRHINPHVRGVIISAYEQFEYAKQALELGVNDYILKPINRDKLKNVLNKIITEIEDEKKNKNKEMDIQEKLYMMAPALEDGYVYSILMDCNYRQQACDYRNLLDIEKEYGYFIVIEFEKEIITKSVKNEINIGHSVLYKKIRDSIKYKCKSVVGMISVNRIGIVVYEDKEENSYEQKEMALELAINIHKSLAKIIETDLSIGIGSCYKNEEINNSYFEAIKALGETADKKVMHIKDLVNNVKLENSYNLIEIKNEEDIIIKKIKEGNVHEVDMKMKDFFDKLYGQHKECEDIVKNIVIELMVLINMVAYRHGLIIEEYADLSYIDELKQIKEYYNLKNRCIIKAKKIAKEINLEKENKVSNEILEAVEYIKNNYNKELHLKDVADVVAISPQYFCKVFKEELGVNFIDYLTRVRIEQAKKMLNEDNLSIKEICFKIGYNDPNYFSRLFKRIVGVSPKEFH
ncbi:response regulator transcription factor [Clostridium sp. DL1XJH146]